MVLQQLVLVLLIHGFCSPDASADKAEKQDTYMANHPEGNQYMYAERKFNIYLYDKLFNFLNMQ
jgi:hypothetical protein